MTTLLGAKALAIRAGVDVATVCRWARAGLLPSLGKLEGPRGAWVFDAEAVRDHPLIAKRPPAGAASTAPQPGGHGYCTDLGCPYFAVPHEHVPPGHKEGIEVRGRIILGAQ